MQIQKEYRVLLDENDLVKERYDKQVTKTQ